MKKTLFSLLVSALLISCGSENEPTLLPTEPLEPNQPKEYIVSLGFSGEITDITEMPLSRAVTNDLYGIQVYSAPLSATEYKPYAYGLFDDKANMTIKLLDGYKYKFISTMVVSGKNRISKFGNAYQDPFIVFNGNHTKGVEISTNFTISSSYEYPIFNISAGSTTINDVMYGVPNADRYYGELEGYVPTENGKASINMKRVVFGAKFVSDGLTEGKLKIAISKAPEMYIVYGETTEVEDIFTFASSYPYGSKWMEDNYSETIPVSISWEKSDGAVIPLVSQDITFKRNIKTTITVKVKDNSINNGVDISNENNPMVNGDNIVIDTTQGSGSDTEINPQP